MVWYRIQQGLSQLIARPDADVDATLQTLLSGAHWELMKRLTPPDRAHALRVHRELVRRGLLDRDLLQAALLHDVGKADDRNRVTLFHRTLNVLAGKIAPNALERFACRGGWIGHGVHLARRHPTLGAELARQTGASQRTCWLIAHHDDGTISGDSALRALQEIDAKE